MIPIQRAEIALALSHLVVAKGSTPLEMDQVLVPVANIQNLSETPYVRYGIPVARGAPYTAVAAQRGYLVARPGAQKILQIARVAIYNTEATTQDYTVKLYPAAQLAAFDTALNTPLNFIDLTDSVMGRFASSSVVQGSDAVDVSIGAVVRVGVPTVSHVIVDLPAPGIVLYGNDPNGIPGCAIVSTNNAVGFAGSFYGKEWPLPGQ